MTKPKDSESRKIGAKAKSIVHYKVNSDCWEFKQETGNDFGRDCILELSEEDEWCNHKVEGQIKGTSTLKFIDDGKKISFPMPVKTIEYALGSSTAFILFIVDTITENVYIQCIQKYFIDHKNLFDKLNQQTISINIPIDNDLSKCDHLLQKWAKTTYIDGPGPKIREHMND